MFKFVDEESDDYFKNVKDDEQYEAGEGEGMGMGMKIGLGVGLLAVVGLVVFFATKGGGEETADDTTPADDQPDDTTPDDTTPDDPVE